MKRYCAFSIILAATVASAACNKDNGGGAGEAPSATPKATPPAPPPIAAPPPSAATNEVPKQKVEIAISGVANTMTFDKKTLTVPTGAEVHLTLKNPATMATLPHNWALVAPGTQAKVAAEGLAKAPDAGFIVEGPNVLAYTPLAPPGGTSEVTFTAPAPGTYPYICTVPGHYLMMKGVMTVTP
jgi:azurin